MSKSSAKDAGLPPLPHNADALFDELMKEIEPELTAEQIDTLDEKYKDETPEEHKARMERYAQAFLLYRTKKEGYFATLKIQMQQWAKQKRKHFEQEVESIENTRLQQLEDQFSS